MAEINTIAKPQNSTTETEDAAKYGFTLKHIGINCVSKNEAAEIAGVLCALFGMERKEIRNGYSYFAGTVVECMSATGRGTHGHIAIGTCDVPGALAYLENKGVRIAEETRKFNENGECTFAYLQGEIGGFAIHITQQ